MKHFRVGRVERGHGESGILLGKDGEDVFSIAIEGDRVVFREECDGYFTNEMSPAEAIEALNEAISWIKDNRQATDKNPSSIRQVPDK